MMELSKKSFEPFTGWVTRQIHKLRRDQFFLATLRLTFLYFAATTVVVLFVGIYNDNFLRDSFYHVAVTQTGDTVDQVFTRVQEALWARRLIQLSFFVVLAYVLAVVAMRPLKKSAELQKNFVATVSHQFKTPLAVMRTRKEVALRKSATLTKEDLVLVLRENLVEINRLTSIIQFLTRFSRIEDGVTLSTKESFDVVAMVRGVVDGLQKVAGNRNISIVCNTPPRLLVRGNEVALREMVINLVSNAIQYSFAGGSVQVNIFALRKFFVLTIADRGVGILPQDLPHIFEPFYRGSHKAGDPGLQGGVGLGLYVVKEIVQLHQGSITVSPRQPGTEITVRLPIISL